MSRSRRIVAALLLVGLLVSSGCLGFITGESALTFASSDVFVSEQARSETGYTETRDVTNTITRNFTVAGQTRTVKVTNHLAEYKRQVSLPVLGTEELARFTVLSTPQVEIAGRTFNPVGDLSNRELAMRLQGQYETISNVEFVDNRTVQILGAERTVAKFSAEATLVGGQSVDVYLHITKFAHGEDFIVAVAIYPQALEGEQERVNRLLRGIKHQTG